VGRIVDVMTRDQNGIEALIECKHGNELTFDQYRRGQIEDYFAYSKSHGSKVRLYIGSDITGLGAKDYVRCAIELHEQSNVPLEIYIKGELMSIEEVKVIVGG